MSLYLLVVKLGNFESVILVFNVTTISTASEPNEHKSLAKFGLKLSKWQIGRFVNCLVHTANTNYLGMIHNLKFVLCEMHKTK